MSHLSILQSDWVNVTLGHVTILLGQCHTWACYNQIGSMSYLGMLQSDWVNVTLSHVTIRLGQCQT